MKKLLLLTILSVLCSSSVFAAPNYSLTQNQPQPGYNTSSPGNDNFKLNNNKTLKGSVITVPAGQTLQAVMTTPVSSETAIVGQNVTMAFGSDFYYNGQKIAPAGSTIYGTVIEVSKARHGSLNGKLTLRFNQIITTSGTTIPISAVVKTDDNTGTLVGGTHTDVIKDYSKDIAVGASAGALTGLIVSPLAGGSIGRGTSLATAVGAGGGLVKSIWDKGADVEIPVNSAIDIILTQPITVSPAVFENKSFGQ